MSSVNAAQEPGDLRIGLVVFGVLDFLVARSLVGRGRTAWIAAVAIMGIRGAGDVAIALWAGTRLRDGKAI